MKLKKISGEKPNFGELDQMLEVMNNLLEGRDADLTIEEICSFQGKNGSFSLLDSTNVPNEAIVDFINLPSYICTSILMKDYLQGNDKVKENFIKGGLLAFLENEREICPKFQCMIHNIIHNYNANLIKGETFGPWGEDYKEDWKSITRELKVKRRLYLAYGSNMNKEQMHKRCPDAKVVGKTYLKDWELTIPFYANIEPNKGEKTPALIWEISNNDEIELDRYEVYPIFYDKKELIVNIEGKDLSVMAYIMTDRYKNENKTPREDYIDIILKGYEDAGFDRNEFDFRLG